MSEPSESPALETQVTASAAQPADFHLNEHLPYLLASTAGRTALAFSRPTSELDLTLKMWRVLAVLSEYAELRLSDIAHLTAIDISTLSRLVTTMHKRRLIGRRRSTRSKREIVITLAPGGEDRLARLIPQAQLFEAAMTQGLSAEAIETTKRTLRCIFENLDALSNSTESSVPDDMLRTL